MASVQPMTFPGRLARACLYVDVVSGPDATQLISQLAAFGPGFYVYMLTRADGRLVYVGSTRDLPTRIRAHARRWPGTFCRVVIEAYRDAASMLEMEDLTIAYEMPPLNIASIR